MALLQLAAAGPCGSLFSDFSKNKKSATTVMETMGMRSLNALTVTDDAEDQLVNEHLGFNANKTFQIPKAMSNPADFVYRNCGENVEGAKIKFNHGTTCLAFKFQGGVVVCTDSRATAGGYIASQTVKKVIEINRFLLGTMAGGAADCQFWERVLAEQCRIVFLCGL